MTQRPAPDRGLVRLAGQIESYGETQARDEFAGLYFDGTATLHVAFTGGEDLHQRRLQEQLGLDLQGVVFERRAHTLVVLQGVAQRIHQSREAFSNQGIVISSIGERPQDNALGVTLSSHAPEAQRVFDERYGTGLVLVTGQGRSAVVG